MAKNPEKKQKDKRVWVVRETENKWKSLARKAKNDYGAFF